MELLDRCVAMAPSFPEGHYHAAMVRFRLKRYEQCRERVELALARFPRDASQRYLQALLDMREERFAPAIETLVALAGERPGHFPTRIHLASTYLRLGRPLDAAAALSEARELAPWEPSVYLIAAEIASANGESSRVEEILAEGIAVAGPLPELLEYRSVVRALEHSI
jgi:predicted Zn-dependent protease